MLHEVEPRRHPSLDLARHGILGADGGRSNQRRAAARSSRPCRSRCGDACRLRTEAHLWLSRSSQCSAGTLLTVCARLDSPAPWRRAISADPRPSPGQGSLGGEGGRARLHPRRSVPNFEWRPGGGMSWRARPPAAVRRDDRAVATSSWSSRAGPGRLAIAPWRPRSRADLPMVTEAWPARRNGLNQALEIAVPARTGLASVAPGTARHRAAVHLTHDERANVALSELRGRSHRGDAQVMTTGGRLAGARADASWARPAPRMGRRADLALHLDPPVPDSRVFDVVLYQPESRKGRVRERNGRHVRHSAFQCRKS